MILWRHTVLITAAYFFLMPVAHVLFDFSAVFSWKFARVIL